MKMPRAKGAPNLGAIEFNLPVTKLGLFIFLVKLHPAAPGNCVSIRFRLFTDTLSFALSHPHACSAWNCYVEGPAFLLSVWASLSLSG